MMKPRSSRAAINERTASGAMNKSENSTNGVSVQVRNQAQLMNNQQTAAQAIRKRRSSINVYDQPSSLNSRLRQLETDMLRLDEDRTKLFDDTHSALAQYELRLNEIHAILKSRQDNVEKYVEDMRLLLLAKEEFEKQAKLLNEKHDRIHDKFMHRETTISREIKLLKNKFELLEKNRQFKSIFQKSANSFNSIAGDTNINDDIGFDSNNEFQTNNSTAATAAAAATTTTTTRTRSETNTSDSLQLDKNVSNGTNGISLNKLQKQQQRNRSVRNVQVKLSKLHSIGKFVTRLFGPANGSRLGKKSNRVSSIHSSEGNQMTTTIADSINPQLNDDNFIQLDNNQQSIEPSINANSASIRANKITNLKHVGLFGRLFR